MHLPCRVQDPWWLQKSHGNWQFGPHQPAEDMKDRKCFVRPKRLHHFQQDGGHPTRRTSKKCSAEKPRLWSS